MSRSGSPALLPLLRSRTQAELLQRLFLQPDREWSVSELAEHVGVTDVSLRRELHRLEHAAILASRDVGRTRLYWPDRASPLFEPLEQLVERSVGVEAQLRALLSELNGVTGAAIFGSWARGRVGAESDVDVLVIGDIDYGTLAEELMDLQERVGREINAVVMRPGELEARLAEGSGFAREIVASPVTPLVGEIDLPDRV